MTCSFFCLAGTQSSPPRGPEGAGWRSAGLMHSLFGLQCLCPRSWLWCVAQVLPPRGEVFGVDPIWEQRGGLLLRHAGRDHHAVSGLEADGGSEVIPHSGRSDRVPSGGVGATYLPVSRCGHSSACCDLERVDHS